MLRAPRARPCGSRAAKQQDEPLAHVQDYASSSSQLRWPNGRFTRRNPICFAESRKDEAAN
jgi:hypothetical protein